MQRGAGQRGWNLAGGGAALRDAGLWGVVVAYAGQQGDLGQVSITVTASSAVST